MIIYLPIREIFFSYWEKTFLLLEKNKAPAYITLLFKHR